MTPEEHQAAVEQIRRESTVTTEDTLVTTPEQWAAWRVTCRRFDEVQARCQEIDRARRMQQDSPPQPRTRTDREL